MAELDPLKLLQGVMLLVAYLYEAEVVRLEEKMFFWGVECAGADRMSWRLVWIDIETRGKPETLEFDFDPGSGQSLYHWAKPKGYIWVLQGLGRR